MSDPEQPPDPWQPHETTITIAHPENLSRIQELRKDAVAAGHIRAMSDEEISDAIQLGQFIIAQVNDIIEGCVRIFPSDTQNTGELGSFVVSELYQGNGVSKVLLDYIEDLAVRTNLILISVTGNELLKMKLQKRGWKMDNDGIYVERILQSPAKTLYVKHPSK